MGRSAEQPFLFSPDTQSLDVKPPPIPTPASPTLPVADIPAPVKDGLFPDLKEQREVCLDNLKVVSDPIVKVTRRQRHKQVTISKEWFCHARYQRDAQHPQPYNLCVLHAHTVYEQVSSLRIKADDLLRVSGRTSRNPTPLRDGSELQVHHIYVTEVAITRVSPRRRKRTGKHTAPKLF